MKNSLMSLHDKLMLRKRAHQDREQGAQERLPDQASSGKQKIPISLGNQDFTIFYFSFKWCHQESNRGHKDFQSFALPTELWHQQCAIVF